MLPAVEFAKCGAKVVVNDLGGSVDGTGAGDAADAVVAEIAGFGGTAVANDVSVADRDGAKSIANAHPRQRRAPRRRG